MLTCKQVSNSLAKEHFHEMTPWRRFLVRFHLSWCFICGRFNKDVIVMQEAAEKFREHEEQDPPSPVLRMSPECRKRMQEALRKSAPPS